MSDFVLQIKTGPVTPRGESESPGVFDFPNGAVVRRFDFPEFALTLARCDGFELWEPFLSKGEGGRNVWVALAGRVALSDQQWNAGGIIPGEGGPACKAIAQLYQAEGIDAIRRLSGNFIVFVFDEHTRSLMWVSDACGMYLSYHSISSRGGTVFASRPELVARIEGSARDFDLDSMGEFLKTGRVSFPNTYFQNVNAQEFGVVHSWCFQTRQYHPGGAAPLFQTTASIDPSMTEQDLARDLAECLRDSVHRRTNPRLGVTGLGLSGGLDSRTLLSCVRDDARVITFFLMDSENAEYDLARRIARALDVELIPIQRPFDYYGESAESGVKLSGGMGNLASNHYLGILPNLRQIGIENLVTGCYCDYLFKGLALNRRESRFLRTEQITHFKQSYYRPLYTLSPKYERAAQNRLESLCAPPDSGSLSDNDWMMVEKKRTFPLAYECDLAQRVIPQRTFGWSPPLVDYGLLEVYQRIPARMKLNASIFRKAMAILCDDKVCRIPDNGTGAPVHASRAVVIFHKYRTALLNRIAGKFRPSIASRGSWPNWDYYVAHSKLVESSWKSRSPHAAEVIEEIAGDQVLRRSPAEFSGPKVEWFLRLWTLKLWLGQQG